MRKSVSFVVLGAPATKGSTVSFVGYGGKVITKTDSTGLASWTQAVGWAARAAGVARAGRDVPVIVYATFEFARPRSAPRTRVFPTVRPDADKVTRALLDALTDVAYLDDAQVIDLVIAKRYGHDTRTTITVEHVAGAEGAGRGVDRMTPQRIQRKRLKGWRMPEGVVYVGRGSKWGNPFRLGQPSADDCMVCAEPAEAVAKFRSEITTFHGGFVGVDAETIRRELRGKDLACWCPLVDKDGNRVPCHADVLLELANTIDAATGEAAH